MGIKEGMNLLFGKKDIIGLDIGSSAIKLVELKGGKHGYELRKLGEAPVPAGAIVNKAIVDPEAVAGALSGLVEKLGTKTKDVAISVSGNAVIIKRLTLPKMNHKDMDVSVVWEIEQSITQKVEDINYDFQVLPGEKAGESLDVLVVVAKKEIANAYMSVVRDAGLNPVVVDVDAFALENMYEMNYKHQDKIVALADIGASLININVLRDGVSIFTTDITVGGNQLTDSIQRRYSLGHEETEKKKRTLGSAGAVSDLELERMTREFTRLVCREIQKTLDFFSATLGADEITRIMVGGGASKIPHIEESLEELTGTAVEVINPFKNVVCHETEFDPEYIRDIAPKMGVATGLALRRAGDRA